VGALQISIDITEYRIGIPQKRKTLKIELKYAPAILSLYISKAAHQSNIFTPMAIATLLVIVAKM
jgi:hypothetical protein